MWMILILLAAVALAVCYLRKLRRLEPQAKALFLDHIDCFSDSLPPLLSTISRKDSRHMQSLLKLWHQRAAHFPALQTYLLRSLCCMRTPLGKGRLLLHILQRWGLEYDPQDQLLSITKELEKAYFFDDIYQLGDLATVNDSAWWATIDGQRRCIRRGTAEIQEETP